MSEWALILGVVALALIVIAVVVVGRRRRTGGDLSPVETTGPSRIGRSAAALGASLRRGAAGRRAHLAGPRGGPARRRHRSRVHRFGGGRRPGCSPETPEQARTALAKQLRGQLGDKNRELHLEGDPAVILVVGVNGTGKTTTIAKLAARLQRDGQEVVLAAGDIWRRRRRQLILGVIGSE